MPAWLFYTIAIVGPIAIAVGAGYMLLRPVIDAARAMFGRKGGNDG